MVCDKAPYDSVSCRVQLLRLPLLTLRPYPKNLPAGFFLISVSLFFCSSLFSIPYNTSPPLYWKSSSRTLKLYKTSIYHTKIDHKQLPALKKPTTNVSGIYTHVKTHIADKTVHFIAHLYSPTNSAFVFSKHRLI